MSDQKFKRCDVVHIKPDLPSYMSHFEKDKDAVILHSYAEKYGGADTNNYAVLLIDSGTDVAWYNSENLIFVRYENEEFVSEIKIRNSEWKKKHSDLNWIVENWRIFTDKLPTESGEELMRLIGITEPWGLHGEYVDFMSNWQYTQSVLGDVLDTGNIKVVRDFIKDFPKVDSFVFSNNVYSGGHETKKPPFVPAQMDTAVFNK